MQIATIGQTNSIFTNDLPLAARRDADNPIVPLLEATLSQTHAQGVYVYRFDEGEVVARLAAWVGQSPGAPTLRLPLHGKTAREHVARTSPIVMQEGAAEDWRDTAGRNPGRGCPGAPWTWAGPGRCGPPPGGSRCPRRWCFP